MAIALQTSTTMVNAAFLQEVKDSNVELWDAMHTLRGMIETPAATVENTRQLVLLLGQIRDLLALEFSLEEAYGFIEGCRGLAPLYGQRTAQARQQHRELYLLIHELCEQAEEAQYCRAARQHYAALLVAAADFDAQLRAHEQLEADLITAGFRGA
jgi:hypothetical protein